MINDKQGNALSGATREAANYFDSAVASFNIYRGDPVAEIDKAIQAAPDFPMAQIFKAHVLGLATEPDLTSAAVEILRDIKAMRLSDREASHVHALDLLLAGRWTAAAEALDLHNSRYPLDILALQSGHIIDFYRASARGLRDRPARVLPQWSADIPGYSIVLGMYAFGLEEAGDYVRAEDTGRYAVELQPLDCWAHHAVAHVLEMQGRPREGINWMTVNEANWSGNDNFFQGHNWWHYAVYLLELGEGAEALRLYDRHIGGTQSLVALDLVDASAMLWRLTLAGVDVGDRWSSVADRWERHVDGHSYPFNDWHAVMANLGAGRDQQVEQILQLLRQAAAGTGESEEWARRYGLPLSEGFAAFWREDYAGAVQQLRGARDIVNGFGGSHAQRDIIDLTLLEAALRGGPLHLARALANERCALKPNGRMNREFLARSQRELMPCATA
jgi:tetratricopeptide (TPR) repeat protein